MVSGVCLHLKCRFKIMDIFKQISVSKLEDWPKLFWKLHILYPSLFCGQSVQQCRGGQCYCIVVELLGSDTERKKHSHNCNWHDWRQLCSNKFCHLCIISTMNLCASQGRTVRQFSLHMQIKNFLCKEKCVSTCTCAN